MLDGLLQRSTHLGWTTSELGFEEVVECLEWDIVVFEQMVAKVASSVIPSNITLLTIGIGRCRIAVCHFVFVITVVDVVI